MFFRDLPSVEIQKRQIIDGGGKNNTFHLDVVSQKKPLIFPDLYSSLFHPSWKVHR